MSVEEKVIQKYEEVKKMAEEVREKVNGMNGSVGDAMDHFKYETQLEMLSELLGIPYEYKRV